MSQLKSALLLLNNVYFEHKKFTRESFADKLSEEGLANSPKKITDLLKFIDGIFGIELTFKRKPNTIQVVLDENNQYHFIKSLLLNGKLKKELLQNENHIISFTSDSNFNYADIIFDIYESIIKTTKIKIDYKNFYGVQTDDIILKPLLLKEYLSRWYLIAEREDQNIRVYGLERITQFKQLQNKFTSSIKTIELYKNTIGVNYSANVELIKLKVEDYQLKLFETNPLHPSQKIIESNKEFGIITLKVAINYEFKQLLSSFLAKVIVLEPESLKTEMKEIFENILKNYSV